MSKEVIFFIIIIVVILLFSFQDLLFGGTFASLKDGFDALMKFK